MKKKEIKSKNDLMCIIPTLDEYQIVKINTENQSISEVIKIINNNGIKIKRIGFKTYLLHSLSHKDNTRKYILFRLLFFTTFLIVLFFILFLSVWKIISIWDKIEYFANQNPILASIFGGLVVIIITSIPVILKKGLIRFSLKEYLGNSLNALWKK